MDRKRKAVSEHEEISVEEDYGTSECTVLIDLFNDILDLEFQVSEGKPDHSADDCGRSKTACAKTLKAFRSIILGTKDEDGVEPSYDTIEVQFDRHRVARTEKLHFDQYPEIIDATIGNPAVKKLFLRTGEYPFTTSITDSTLMDGMVKIARVLAHNWITLEHFTFTSFAIHGTYGEHRENAWVSIQGRRIK
jgi:hypothetical protein